MIEKCFKCDGSGKMLQADKVDRIDYIINVSSVTCDRCEGSGALFYEKLKGTPVKETPAPKQDKEYSGDL